VKRVAIFAAVLLSLGALALTLRAPVHRPERRSLPPFEFTDSAGRALTIEAFAGQVVLLDFWATWCKPCRDEFPVFDRLQARLASKGLVVVPVSIDLKGMPAVDAFYAETGVIHLAKYSDPSRDAARAAGFAGLPSALLIDRHGREAARVEGAADWESGRVAEILSRLLDED
jgi:thiol-disulfide isomerase/thioredoxin